MNLRHGNCNFRHCQAYRYRIPERRIHRLDRRQRAASKPMTIEPQITAKLFVAEESAIRQRQLSPLPGSLPPVSTAPPEPLEPAMPPPPCPDEPPVPVCSMHVPPLHVPFGHAVPSGASRSAAHSVDKPLHASGASQALVAARQTVPATKVAQTPFTIAPAAMLQA